MRLCRLFLARCGRLTVVTAALVALAACGDTTPGSGVDPSTFDGDWQLTSGRVDGVDLDVTAGDVTLTAEGTRWGGTSGCNRYFATATLEGDQVTVTGVGGTEMACDEPRMALEAAYVAGLQRVTTVTTDGDTLTLGGDGVDLRFAPVPAVPQPDLVGTTWTLTTLLDGDAASSVTGEAILLLAKGGKVSGSTGCRAFRGRWEQGRDSIVIGPLATPRIACGPDTQAQDAHVLKVLDGEVVVTMDGGSLTLTHGDLGLGYTAP